MSPEAGQALVTEIMPRIQGAILSGAVHGVGPEDAEELVQDTLATAAKMLDRAEASGAKFSPSTVAYYAIQRMKVGRRSTGPSSADAMSPEAAIRRGVQFSSMDEAMPGDEDEESLDLHSILASPRDDPGTEAVRNIAWDELQTGMGEKERVLLDGIAFGLSGNDIAEKLCVSAPRVTQLKREIAATVAANWGENILSDISHLPSWQNSLLTSRERQDCRAERVRLSRRWRRS